MCIIGLVIVMTMMMLSLMMMIDDVNDVINRAVESAHSYRI